jgi:hypothetical protein
MLCRLTVDLPLRSLTILEGIAITANPDFKIVDVAYPYVAARLLSSESEQLQSALQEMVLDDRGRLKWSRLLPLFAALSADGAPAPAEPAAGEAGEGGQGEGEVSRTKVVGVVRYLLSERGEVFVDALVEDLIDAADNVQLSANVLLSVASGGLVPPPREKPSIGNLQMRLRVLDTLTDVAAAGVRASVADTAAAWERGLGEGVWQGGVDGGLGGAEAILRSFGIEDREMQRRAVATAERVVGEVARGLAERFVRVGCDTCVCVCVCMYVCSRDCVWIHVRVHASLAVCWSVFWFLITCEWIIQDGGASGGRLIAAPGRYASVL